MASLARRRQPAASKRSLGNAFISPRRPRDKAKTSAPSHRPGKLARLKRIQDELDEILQRHRTGTSTAGGSPDGRREDSQDATSMDDIFSEDLNNISPAADDSMEDIKVESEGPGEDSDSDGPERPGKPSKNNGPSAKTYRLYNSWKILIPKLVEPYLSYTNATMALPVPPAPDTIVGACGCLTKKTHKLLCLYSDHIKTIFVQECACQSLPQLLVINGLFPTAPLKPNFAVSIELLKLYQALFERSCDAVNALAAALHTFYTRRGFHLTNIQDDSVQDAFRKSLGNAIQWHDVIQVELDRRIDNAVAAASVQLEEFNHQAQVHPILSSGSAQASFYPQASPHPQASATLSPGHPIIRDPSTGNPLTYGQASRILRQRCPACFGDKVWGQSFQSGGDCHVALDGNFHHRHRKSAGDGPPFYDPSYFLSKSQVDDVGQRIDAARLNKPRTYESKVPDSAVDECEHSHDAADGRKQKANSEQFDDTGVMALICRHDIPLFLTNIDTPGEQQKYAVSLIEHLYSHLPLLATVCGLYDVGCVLDRSMNMYDILSNGIRRRIIFATTAMHAYAHQWACQLIYNPRLCKGLGLTDGEGVERLWSRLRKLIGIQRSSGRQRRIWLIDRLLASVGSELRDDLGDWIKRKFRRGVTEQGRKAQKILNDCGYSIDELRLQWELQVEAQTSIRAHAPQRLKKQVDSVFTLQSEVQTVEQSIQSLKKALGVPSSDTTQAISSLSHTQERLMGKIEDLYASLNIHSEFPELQDVPIDFLKLLLLARDLKINIRKRAVGAFFEFDKLDQAVGGGHQALGTKLHQYTRKAISRRTPALLNSVRKYNKYCDRLEELRPNSCDIPIPTPLPTKLADLRNSSTLMEDVWIAHNDGELPLWLSDADVRDGIRAMLKVDRCLEEQRRLGIEADNLCRWLASELTATEVALRHPNNKSLVILLKQKLTQLRFLEKRWGNFFATPVRLRSAVDNASLNARIASGEPIHQLLQWLTPVTIRDCDLNTNTSSPLHEDHNLLEAGETALGDYLFGESDTSEQDEEDTVALVADIVWAVPDNMTSDERFPMPFPSHSTVELPIAHCTVRVLHPANGLPTTYFDVEDIMRFHGPMKQLTGSCINSAGALLMDLTKNSLVALFSTYELVRIRDQMPDNHLWKNIKHTMFWNKDVWVIPIHRPNPGHWVLCTVYLHEHRILLFDSLGGRHGWDADFKDIIRFIERIASLARSHDYILNTSIEGRWIAQPVFVRRLSLCYKHP